jgi:hypothetical protein
MRDQCKPPVLPYIPDPSTPTMTGGRPSWPPAEGLTPHQALRILDRFYDANGPDEKVATALTRLWDLVLKG